MQERDKRIDILRGLAIFTMIAANMAAHSLNEPHSFGFRLYGSIAAPLFIFISGMMVSFTCVIKNHNLNYYLKRAFIILIIASAMDTFLWTVLPFTTFDVLYVIAFSAPLIYFYIKLKRLIKIAILLVLIGMTPVLQHFFGYQEYPVEIYLDSKESLNTVSTLNVWRQLFIDGWFPVFPWLGVAFFGAYIGTIKWSVTAEKLNKIILILGCCLMLPGIFIWLLQSPELLIREGYSELFYPPTVPYILTFSGLILILMRVLSEMKELRFLGFLSIYGKSSLFVYIMHTVLIVFVFNQLDSFPMSSFVGLYLLHSLVLLCLCWMIQKITAGKKLPLVVKMIVGG